MFINVYKSLKYINKMQINITIPVKIKWISVCYLWKLTFWRSAFLENEIKLEECAFDWVNDLIFACVFVSC